MSKIPPPDQFLVAPVGPRKTNSLQTHGVANLFMKIVVYAL